MIHFYTVSSTMICLFRVFITGAAILSLGILLGVGIQITSMKNRSVEVVSELQPKPEPVIKAILKPIKETPPPKKQHLGVVSFDRPAPLPYEAIPRTRKHAPIRIIRNLTAGMSGVMTRTSSVIPLKSRCSWYGSDDGECMVENILQRYFHARMKGLSIEQVAEEEFGVLLEWDSNYPHSYPFMTADTLRAMADIVVDSPEALDELIQMNVDPTVRNGTLIYMEPPSYRLLQTFSIKLLPLFQHSFILITLNSVIPMVLVKYVEDLLQHPLLYHWFSQNAALEHPKLTPVPVGMKPYRKMEDYERFETILKDEFVPPLFCSSGSSTEDRDILVPVLMNPYSNEGQRTKAIESVEKISTIPRGRPGLLHYFRWLTRSKFVLSPPGRGEDCYRTWEAILFKAIPIVLNSTLHTIFQEAPCYVVDTWEAIDEQQLLNFCPKTFSRKGMMAQYWMNKINVIRRQILVP